MGTSSRSPAAPAAPAAAAWRDVCPLAQIPPAGARVVKTARGQLALFRTADDVVYALLDACPHKGGPLSQGIVHGHTVTCPLHGRRIDLATGALEAPDVGCTHRFAVRVEGGRVLLDLR
jgi:nitrite reductase (NADH) small subunit